MYILVAQVGESSAYLPRSVIREWKRNPSVRGLRNLLRVHGMNERAFSDLSLFDAAHRLLETPLPRRSSNASPRRSPRRRRKK